MQITIEIPDILGQQLQATPGNLERKMLELCVIEAYRNAWISAGKARELLGFLTRLELDAFFKARAVDLNYDLSDLQQDLETLEVLQSKETQLSHDRHL
jgi:predicted HTH domain antitoxin